jgi:1D-myo-inositol 3-kinase
VSILVAGHYCHDILLSTSGEARALGGSASYASAVLEAFGEPYEVAAKVGADFLYAKQVFKAPLVVGARTTSFVDDYRSGEREEHVGAVTEALRPEDLRGEHAVGMACAVAGEVPLETLRRMRELCRTLVADAQGLLRVISPRGEVLLKAPPPETFALLDYLKASKSEAALLDTASLRKRLTLLVTDGPRGCTLLTRDAELQVPAFPARELDPTGAGDCFLAGFAVGLARGLDSARSARIGAYCGARAVEAVGVPRLTAAQVAQALQ